MSLALATNGAMPSSIGTGQSRSASVAADATRLYWIVYTTDTTADIRTMNKTGGTVTALATNESSPDTTPGRLIVDDTNVYWVTTTGALRVAVQSSRRVTGSSCPDDGLVVTIGARRGQRCHAFWRRCSTRARFSGYQRTAAVSPAVAISPEGLGPMSGS